MIILLWYNFGKIFSYLVAKNGVPPKKKYFWIQYNKNSNLQKLLCLHPCLYDRQWQMLWKQNFAITLKTK